MNQKEKATLLKNAVVNVVRGGAAAIVAIVLPPFLTRLMSPDSFGVWSLVLQLSAYIGYLDFGIQTAVGRFVAHANEKGDAGHRDRIVSTWTPRICRESASLGDPDSLMELGSKHTE